MFRFGCLLLFCTAVGALSHLSSDIHATLLHITTIASRQLLRTSLIPQNPICSSNHGKNVHCVVSGVTMMLQTIIPLKLHQQEQSTPSVRQFSKVIFLSKLLYSGCRLKLSGSLHWKHTERSNTSSTWINTLVHKCSRCWSKYRKWKASNSW